jgi:PAS domain S-box-containing protein
MPLAGFLFVYQAHYSVLQALAQMGIFTIEISIICYLADRFAQATMRAESSEREARCALDEKQIFFELIENSSDFISIADRNLKIIYLNLAGRKLVGLTEDSLLANVQLFDLSPPWHREYLSSVIVPAVLKSGCWHGKTYLLDQKLRTEISVSSSCCLIRDTGSSDLLGIGIVARDISEIARTEEALKRSEAELKEAQRLARVGNWSWEVQADRLTWSDELYRVFGRSKEVPISKYIELLRLFTQDCAKLLDEAVAKTLEDGTAYELELELARRPGVEKWISTKGEAIRNVSGKIIGLRGTAQDITEVKELQKMREEWNSVIAHDLRQPISLIAMSAELLPSLHQGPMSEKERAVDKNIQSAATSLSRMVDDLLDISRMESSRLVIEPRWIDPRILIRESLERMFHLLSGVRVMFKESGELLPVFADQVRIEQVINNLVSNAAKYGNKGSPVIVQISQHPDELEVSVTNEGQGIPEEEIPVLFNRFWRSKRTRNAGVPGLGLGLYIAKGLIEAHGGRIWVKSIPGQTTTFYFTLPTRRVGKQNAA